MVFTFEMSDAWGDNYRLDVEAPTRQNAERIANTVDDDAVVLRLVKTHEAHCRGGADK